MTGAGVQRRDWRDFDWEVLHPPAVSPALHMALDEVLTRRVGAGERSPTLRVWEWERRAVALGRYQSLRNELQPEGVEKYGVTVARRPTGGGAMFIEPGNTITYSLYAPESLVAGLSFVDSYAFLDAWAVDALREMGVNAWYVPINDITSEGGKIGGAAQARFGGAVLHHATLAYDMNSSALTEILRIGQEKLSDKGITSAAKRVGPIRLQTDLPREEVIRRMLATFRAQHGGHDGQLGAGELGAAEQLAREKYATPEWTALIP